MALDMKIKVVVIIGIVALTVIVSVAAFAYRNMHHDIITSIFRKRGYKLGFREDIAKLDDGSEIYYIEGIDTGPNSSCFTGNR